MSALLATSGLVRHANPPCSHEQRDIPDVIEVAPRITVDEEIRFGRLVIQGTRVPVELVIGKLVGGMTQEGESCQNHLGGLLYR